MDVHFTRAKSMLMYFSRAFLIISRDGTLKRGIVDFTCISFFFSSVHSLSLIHVVKRKPTFIKKNNKRYHVLIRAPFPRKDVYETHLLRLLHQGKRESFARPSAWTLPTYLPYLALSWAKKKRKKKSNRSVLSAPLGHLLKP